MNRPCDDWPGCTGGVGEGVPLCDGVGKGVLLCDGVGLSDWRVGEGDDVTEGVTVLLDEGISGQIHMDDTTAFPREGALYTMGAQYE